MAEGLVLLIHSKYALVPSIYQALVQALGKHQRMKEAGPLVLIMPYSHLICVNKMGHKWPSALGRKKKRAVVTHL